VRRFETTDGKGGRRVFEGAIVIGADGIRSVVARRLGFVKRKPRIWKISLTCRLRGSGPSRQQGSLFLCRQGTVGLAPVGANGDLWNGTIVVTGRSAGRVIAANPLRGFRQVLASAPFRWDGDGPEVVGGPWACGPFDWPIRTVVGDGVLLVGDAAGYFDPLTGQGIARIATHEGGTTRGGVLVVAAGATRYHRVTPWNRQRAGVRRPVHTGRR
jgi:2-polyprenyl-6-methoxyphenol hydroxylase-like FAD-dependent oxidoreductase